MRLQTVNNEEKLQIIYYDTSKANEKYSYPIDFDFGLCLTFL